MSLEENKIYQEQISSLNQIIIDLQKELYSKEQNIQILENDLLALNNDSAKEYKHIYEQSPNIIVILDHFGKIKNLNYSAINFFKKQKYFLVENSFRKLLNHTVFNEFTNQFNDFINKKDMNTTIFHFLQLKDKRTFTLSLKKISKFTQKSSCEIIGVLLPYNNTDSQSSNYLSHIVLDQLRDGVIITNEKGEILKVNNAFTEITGYNIVDVLGKNPKVLKSNRHYQKFYEKLWHDITHHGWWAGEIWNKKKNGEVYPEWLQINRVVEPVTKKVFYTSIFSDISNRKMREMELDRLAHYDTLTGLINRHFLQISLSNLLEKSKNRNTINAILFLDLDHFKQVNDIYGHHEGDLVLQEAAQRILASVRTNDIVARVGGDEFVVVLSRIQNEDLIIKIGDLLLQELKKPFFVNNNEHFIGASIGVAIYPKHGNTINELMRRADSAMYRSKNSGRNMISIFEEKDELNIQKQDYLKNLIFKIIKNHKKQLEIFYQPIFNIKTNEVSSLEALLRIKNEENNYENPEIIINTAETEGLIIELGEIIFEEICKFYSFNKKNLHKNIPIAINLSVLQLSKNEFIESFTKIASKYDLKLNDFNFEITETRVMENLDNLFKTISNLNKLGSKISLDDFGTGYASLAQLHNLPIDTVKIDKSFTFRLDDDMQTKKMVNAMVLMTHSLNCKIVIEGVETQKSLDWLKSINADFAQGYLLSKPLDKDTVRKKFF